MASGGTKEEANEILNELKMRIRYARHGISFTWHKCKLKDDSIYNELSHDIKNLFSSVDMFLDVLLNRMK
ncbi:MAG: hypothetical protein NZ903_03365 [Candidatus Micrarchaeota archaeon]|nr:hypothetical protein [Candidatus Micrarchaeota archaeon]